MALRRFAAVPVFAAVTACSFDSGGVGDGAADGGSSGTGPGSTSTTMGETAASATSATLDGSTSTPTTTTTEPETSSGATTSGSESETTHGSSESGSESSTGDPGPVPFGPFGDAVPIDELNSIYFDDDPTLLGNQLEIYFATLRPEGPGAEDIWFSQRGAKDEAWDPPQPVPDINSPSQDGWPELSHDGLWMTFGSDRAGGEGGFDVYLLHRSGLAADWGDPVRVDELSSFLPEGGAVFSDDLLEVVLTVPLVGADDLARATRASAIGTFGAPVPLAELNTLYRDSVPFLDITGTRILFASDRPGVDGSMAIWTATRDLGMDFGAPEQVIDVDVTGIEDDPWWAPDGSQLWFARTGPGGDLDLFAAPLLGE